MSGARYIMTPQFHPTLVNDPFGDPGVYVDFLFERRALLFDLGENELPPRKLLRLSHIFISHTHVDHFIGFDRLVRICLGRERRMTLFGPPGFVDQVGHRLAGYTWNLVHTYPTDFTVAAVEVHPDGSARSAEFHCRETFRRSCDRSFTISGGILLDEETFRMHTAFLDHRIPSLAYLLEEKRHVNIMKNRLDERGLPTGPWLAQLKREVLADADDGTVFPVRRLDGSMAAPTLRELKEEVLQVVPGQRVAYVTDAAWTEKNRERIVELAKGADTLFIEAVFLHEEAERALEKCHLTTRQAGLLAREAGVARVVPFHFSAKPRGEGERMLREVEEAFSAG